MTKKRTAKKSMKKTGDSIGKRVKRLEEAVKAANDRITALRDKLVRSKWIGDV